jgi:hypothetical protein
VLGEHHFKLSRDESKIQRDATPLLFLPQNIQLFATSLQFKAHKTDDYEYHMHSQQIPNLVL